MGGEGEGEEKAVDEEAVDDDEGEEERVWEGVWRLGQEDDLGRRCARVQDVRARRGEFLKGVVLDMVG